MDLQGIEIFTSVVRTGSFSKAALQLNITKSTVSKKVSDLEAELGVSLLHRTTRKLQLTEIGSEYFQRCMRALNELRDARDLAQENSRKIRGRLRVTAPADFASSLLAPLFLRFMKTHPDLILDLVLTDKPLDLIAEGIDVAIRIGNLKDSSLKARVVGRDTFKLIASPSYLKANSRIESPADVAKLSCLMFMPKPEMTKWRLRKAQSRAVIEPRYTFSANNINAVKSLVMEGAGLSLLPVSTCLEEIARRKLTVVLPDWSMDEAPIHLVYQNHAHTAPRISAFLDFMSIEMRKIFA